MKLYVDMDGVLVNQVGRKRFDLMDWKDDGRRLWEFVEPYEPTILSQLMVDIWHISRHEKRAWVDREIGDHVPLIVVHAEDGKFPYAEPGAILIDDSVEHREKWEARGGIFILHRSAASTIAMLSGYNGFDGVKYGVG